MNLIWLLLCKICFLSFLCFRAQALKCVMCETGVGRRDVNCIDHLPHPERCHDDVEHCIVIFTYTNNSLSKATRYCSYGPVREGCITVSYFNRRICTHLCSTSGCNNAKDSSYYTKSTLVHTTSTPDTPTTTEEFLDDYNTTSSLNATYSEDNSTLIEL